MRQGKFHSGKTFAMKKSPCYGVSNTRLPSFHSYWIRLFDCEAIRKIKVYGPLIGTEWKGSLLAQLEIGYHGTGSELRVLKFINDEGTGAAEKCLERDGQCIPRTLRLGSSTKID